MNEKEYDLLMKDLCGRLPYGVKAQVLGWDEEKGEVEVPLRIYSINTDGYVYFENNDYDVNYLYVDDCLLFLRPMSSMTEEEKEELLNHVLGGEGVEYFHIVHDGSIDGNQEAEQDLYNLNLHWLNFGPLTTSSYIDWLNKNMFDHRGLIPKGLAISTEEFNPYK